MTDQLKPADRLKMIRAQAHDVLQRMGYDASTDESANAKLSDESVGVPDDNMLKPDQLGLFLKSLNSRLSSAISEVRASSADLELLTDEVRKVESFLGKGDWKTEDH
jgi:hypothetical protein